MRIKHCFFYWICTIMLWSEQAGACTLQVTVQQPTCGKNGMLSYTMVPAPAIGASYKFYFNGNLLGTNNGNIASFSGLEPGTYKVIATDLATGCVDSIETVLSTAINSLSVSYFIDSARCDTSTNAKITLIVSNYRAPISYTWSHSTLEKDSIADPLTVGVYFVTISDANNCPVEIDSIKVSEIQGKMLAIDTIIVPTSCDSSNGKIYLTVTGLHAPIDYRWYYSPDSFNMPLDSLGPGKYTCVFNDTLKCHPLIISDLEIVKNPPPKVKIIGTDSVCAVPGIGTLRAIVTAGDSNFISLEWDNDPSLNSKTRQIVDSGNYFVIAKDLEGCADTAVKRVELYPERILHLTAEKNNFVKGLTPWIYLDNPAGLTNLAWASSPASTFDYGIDKHSIRISPDTNTIYYLTAKYGPGCETSTSISIYLVDQKINLVIPNMFTPNGDSKNDIYKLRGENNTINSFEFIVYDRWGNKVFESFDPLFEWNGKDLKGQDLPNNVYPFVMRYTTVTQQFDKIVESGTILLER